LKGATQSVPREASITPMAGLPPQALSTPTVISVTTPTPESTPYTERDKQRDTFGVIAIGVAALFLGGLFAVMTRKKPI
jgi:hypothetical protein